MIYSWTIIISYLYTCINDIVSASSVILHAILYADDTHIFCADKDLHKLINIVNNELCIINDWLLINVNKTNFIIFCPR